MSVKNSSHLSLAFESLDVYALSALAQVFNVNEETSCDFSDSEDLADERGEFFRLLVGNDLSEVEEEQKPFTEKLAKFFTSLMMMTVTDIHLTNPTPE